MVPYVTCTVRSSAIPTTGRGIHHASDQTFTINRIKYYLSYLCTAVVLNMVKAEVFPAVFGTYPIVIEALMVQTKQLGTFSTYYASTHWS